MAGRKSLFIGGEENPIPRKGGSPPGDLDITPMIDVTFLLLIFFMVSSTMQSTPAIDLPPAAHSKGVTVSSSTVITVLAPAGSETSSRILLGDGVGNEATPAELKRYLEEQQRAGLQRVVIKAEGDRDLFGDGSVLLVSTAGHSPGHQCLVVKLPKTGAVMLTGDAVHTQANWDNKRTPIQNFNPAQSAAALDRMAAVLKEHNAQLWIGHEPTEVAKHKYAPAYYE